MAQSMTTAQRIAARSNDG